MRHVEADFDTREEPARETYGDRGCIIRSINTIPMVLRHEWYERKAYDSLYFFGRIPEIGSQVRIDVFPGGDTNPDFDSRLSFHREDRYDFRLPRGQKFEPSCLCPSSLGFSLHEVIRVRDGRTRRRIIHRFSGCHRSVLLTYSLDSVTFLNSPLFKAVSENLHLSDVPLEVPFRSKSIVEQAAPPNH